MTRPSMASVSSSVTEAGRLRRAGRRSPDRWRTSRDCPRTACVARCPLKTRCSDRPRSASRFSSRSWAMSISAALRPVGPLGVCPASRPAVRLVTGPLRARAGRPGWGAAAGRCPPRPRTGRCVAPWPRPEPDGAARRVQPELVRLGLGQEPGQQVPQARRHAARPPGKLADQVRDVRALQQIRQDVQDGRPRADLSGSGREMDEDGGG